MESGVKDDLAPAQTPEDDARMLREQFDEYCQTTLSARKLSERCRDYYDGDQLTPAERKALKTRNQPPVIDNKIQDKVNTLLGIEKQMRTDPQAFPRNPQDEDSAEAATDCLRYIADCNDFHTTTRAPCTKNLIIEGLCGAQVIVERGGKYPKIKMEHIRWDRLYYDVHSLCDDFSDAQFKGMFTWMDFDAAVASLKANKKANKDASNNLEASFRSDGSNETRAEDDKPRYTMTVRRRKRVQVFETYYLKDGVWMYAKWCKGGLLEGPNKSAYKDEDGPACPIELQALYRDSDSMPYGMVARYLDPQDELNKRRSKMLHLVSVKGLIAEKGAFDDIAKARAEIQKPDMVLEPNIGFKYEIHQNLDMSSAQMELLQYTDHQLSQTGPNAALAGQSGDISGRAKQLDQQSGSLMIAPLFDALDSFETRLYRQGWYRARQFWNSEMWIRVTDDENKLKFVGLNQPVLQGDQAAQRMKNDPQFQQSPPEVQQQMVQALAQHPQAQEPVVTNGKPVKKNSVAEMDMDIIIDRTQDVVNIQQEQFQILASLAEKMPPGAIPFDVIVDMSQLRSDVKKRVMDKLSGSDNPQAAQAAQQQQAMQQQMMQLEGRLKDAEASLKIAQVGKTVAETQKIREDTAGAHINAAASFLTAAQPQQVSDQSLQTG